MIQWIKNRFISSWINQKFFKVKRKLRVKWTEEAINDIQALYGLNVQNELTRILKEEITKETVK